MKRYIHANSSKQNTLRTKGAKAVQKFKNKYPKAYEVLGK